MRSTTANVDSSDSGSISCEQSFSSQFNATDFCVLRIDPARLKRGRGTGDSSCFNTSFTSRSRICAITARRQRICLSTFIVSVTCVFLVCIGLCIEGNVVNFGFTMCATKSTVLFCKVPSCFLPLRLMLHKEWIYFRVLPWMLLCLPEVFVLTWVAHSSIMSPFLRLQDPAVSG